MKLLRANLNNVRPCEIFDKPACTGKRTRYTAEYYKWLYLRNTDFKLYPIR